MSSNPIRWGIIGTGGIARKFASAVRAAPDSTLAAVSSRTREQADRFGDEFGIPGRHVGAESLAADGGVDAVYVATPHPWHMAGALASLDGGKAVLCEKPFAMNAAQAKRMVARARERDLFLMEAMWSLCFPAMARVRELLAAGAIGEVRLVEAHFCSRAPWNPAGRLLNRDLGGGALLDLGVYTLAFARMVMGGDPAGVTGQAHIGETGVDEQFAAVLRYRNGALALLTSSQRAAMPHDAAIHGTDGHIRIPHMFWQPERLLVKRGAEEEAEILFEHRENGFDYEIAEATKCLRSGARESRIVPLDLTLSVARTMDALRAQWGLVYPGEKES
jgi:predicted dehydrogenase